MSLSTGTRLGPYEIVAPLGAGGMGEVYKARDTRLGREVAVKVLPADKVADPERRQRFQREARAASALNHPNIVTIYDIDEAEGMHFIVMEYVAGKTLGQSIPTGGMAVEAALHCARQVASGLAKAHAANITHRDLKPANIMIANDGAVKILDFGLAKLDEPPSDDDATRTAPLTQVGLVMGTAAYMSPEQAEGRPTGARSDIFSFGVVFYEMLSGRRAFTGDSPVTTMAAVIRNQPPPLVNLPDQVASIVTRCLQKDPALRFAGGSDLKHSLDQPLPVAEKSPSIAVLPFTNMSGDKEFEYFTDGLAEEIINALTQVPGLKVTARSSAFFFRGKDVELAEIGRKLNVEHVLEGSVRKGGNRIRVTVELIKASDGFHVWSERYDREMTDVFAVQDEITQSVLAKLTTRLGAQQVAPARSRHSQNIDAYNAYLKARYNMYRLTEASLATARRHYETAIQLDPGYALAYSGLAYAVFSLDAVSKSESRATLAEARPLAEKALALDPGLADARAVLGAIHGLLDRNWKAAEEQYRLALSSDPVSSDVYNSYGRWFLFPQGRWDEAFQMYTRAQELDPLVAAFTYFRAETMLAKGEWEPAIREGRAALEIDSGYWLPFLLIGWGEAMLGRYQEAVAAFEAAEAAEPGSPFVFSGLASAYALSGDTQRARAMLNEVLQKRQRGYFSWYCIAIIQYYLDDIDGAFQSLFQAVEGRDSQVFWTRAAVFSKLHADPRYAELCRKLNLPPL